MNELPSEPTKPRFLDLCKTYRLDCPTLQTIADLAHVSYSIVYTMLIDKPVARMDAENVLDILSQYVGKSLSLETVAVPVLASQTQEQAQKSEVARLLTEIQQEYDSACLGLSGLARGTSQHSFITRKMENMGKLQHELERIVGDDVAIAMICEQLGDTSDRPHSSAS